MSGATRSRLVRLWPFGWVRHIPREQGAPAPTPYMDRFTLRKQRTSGANPWRVYLNHFLSPDSEGHHNHPSTWGFSLVLWGSYTEEVLEEDCPPIGLTVRTRRVRWFNWIPSDKYHRIIELHSTTNTLVLWLARRWPARFGALARGVWTLFTVGPLTRRGWGFHEAGRGYVPHEVREAERADIVPAKLTPR